MLSPLFFSNPFLSLDFSLLLCGAVFYNAAAFNGDLSAWDVGKVTGDPFNGMERSTYTFLSRPSPNRGFFWLLLFPLLILCAPALISFLNNAPFNALFVLQSVLQQRFHTNLVRQQMGILVG